MAIIGILTTIAIPEYKDYTVRSKVAEAIAATAPVRMMTAECISLGYTGCTGRAASVNFNNKNSQYVARITGANHNNSFVVELQNIPELPKDRNVFYMVAWQYDAKGKAAPIDTLVKINPNLPINWVCLTKTPKKNMPNAIYHHYIEAKYLPKSCHDGGLATTFVDFYLDNFNP